MNWYIAYTKQGMEQKVLKALEQRRFTAYLPMTKEVSVKDRVGYKPVMPSYVFVQAALTEQTAISKIKGVVSLVYRGEQPVMIDAAVIEHMRRFLEQYKGVKVEKMPIDEALTPSQTTTPVRGLVEGRVERSYQLERLSLPTLGYVLVAEKEGMGAPMNIERPVTEKRAV